MITAPGVVDYFPVPALPVTFYLFHVDIVRKHVNVVYDRCLDVLLKESWPRYFFSKHGK